MSGISVYLLALLHVGPAMLSVFHILLFKRDARAATGWIMACIFIPYAGPVGYFLFGINRVRSRARGIRRRPFTIRYEAGQRKAAPESNVGQGLASVGQRVTGRPLSEQNSIAALHNGEEAYPAMLASINAARQRILLATYIFKTDQTGLTFADALAAAVARGVKVMVLVDGIGEMYSWRKPSKLLRRRGILVSRFLPPKLLPPSVYLNLRNHRKILIVDDVVAYAGGMNISDEHTSAAERPRTVSDLHFSLRGPVVDELAAVFYSDWQFTTRGADEIMELSSSPTDGGASCRVIPDGPDDMMDALALTIQGVVSAARRSVDIMTPYFLPSRELIAALQSAVLRGVRVRVVLPGKNNLFYVHWANRNILSELLEWGVEAYYQPAPFCHSKLLCIDDEYCMIGSANLDPRSLRLNFELAVEIFSGELNAEMCSYIDSIIATSTVIKLDDLVRRSIPARLRDSVAALFAPYL